jgi:hypothetical protein
VKSAVSLFAALVLAFSMTASIGRCATCESAPCCKSDPSDQQQILPRMPCCAPAREVRHVSHPGVAFELTALPAQEAAFTAPAAPRALLTRSVEVDVRPPPLYQLKCALLL